MSSPRPGRRAAPKPARRGWVTRNGRTSAPVGRRVAGPSTPEAPPEAPPQPPPPAPGPQPEQEPQPPAPSAPPEPAEPAVPLSTTPEPPPPEAGPPGASPHAARDPRRATVPGTPEPPSHSVLRLVPWALLLLAGCTALALAALHLGPAWLDGAGAVAVLTTYTWAVMARTGGRQHVFAVLALLVGTLAVLEDGQVLRSGAAVMTCVVSGVLAVVITVPARSFLGAAREVVIATTVASIGAFATVGFEPAASSVRFEYITLGIGFLVMLALVWRFGAGLHGLGTRGLFIVLVGSLLLAGSLVYAELLQRFGVSGLVEPTARAVEWSRDNLGAFPRPIMVFLGVPALAWGVHMRARRRQGWWVCVFGAAGTLAVAQGLVNLDTSYVEAGLQVAYGVALGLLVGYLVIRLDLRLTGQRGRRARAAEAAHAVRPEPPRLSSL